MELSSRQTTLLINMLKVEIDIRLDTGEGIYDEYTDIEIEELINLLGEGV